MPPDPKKLGMDEPVNIDMPFDAALDKLLNTDDTADELPPVDEPLDENRE